MSAMEISGECEIGIVDDALHCDSKTVKFEVKYTDEIGTIFARVCANCVILAEQFGWKSSFISWRDS